jgi:transcription elongation factor GreA
MTTLVPLTLKGSVRLRTELDRLKSFDRPAVIQAISEARAHGDLKENAEYHAAKEQQGFIEARIRRLESTLSNANIIDISTLENSGRVVFGVTVTLVNIETDEKVTYQIVGEDESNMKQNKISITSPIARALIGKELDEEVVVRTPGGEVEYAILRVEFS